MSRYEVDVSDARELGQWIGELSSGPTDEVAIRDGDAVVAVFRTPDWAVAVSFLHVTAGHRSAALGSSPCPEARRRRPCLADRRQIRAVVLHSNRGRAPVTLDWRYAADERAQRRRRKADLAAQKRGFWHRMAAFGGRGRA